VSQAWSTGTAVEAAAVLLGSLVLVRLGLAAGAAGLARGTGRATAALRRMLLALRPRLARRVVAGVVGLAAPATALAPAASTTTAQAVLEPSAAARRPDAPGHGQARVYVVRRGDTLWDIARRHLPPGAGPARVARAWPRWFAANRGVVGDDPSLILPGQRLLIPGRRSAGTPTQPHAAPAPTSGTPVPSALSLDPDRR
jgi:nucleoid-associated protein YgaU